MGRPRVEPGRRPASHGLHACGKEQRVPVDGHPPFGSDASCMQRAAPNTGGADERRTRTRDRRFGVHRGGSSKARATHSKGIRILTCQFPTVSARLTDCHIVALQGPCRVPAGPSRSQLASGCLRAFSAHKAREWQASTQSNRRGTRDASVLWPLALASRMLPLSDRERLRGDHVWWRDATDPRLVFGIETAPLV